MHLLYTGFGWDVPSQQQATSIADCIPMRFAGGTSLTDWAWGDWQASAPCSMLCATGTGKGWLIQQQSTCASNSWLSLD